MTLHFGQSTLPLPSSKRKTWQVELNSLGGYCEIWGQSESIRYGLLFEGEDFLGFFSSFCLAYAHGRPFFLSLKAPSCGTQLRHRVFKLATGQRRHPVPLQLPTGWYQGVPEVGASKQTTSLFFFSPLLPENLTNQTVLLKILDQFSHYLERF